MIELKTNALKYKKPDGSLEEIGVVANGQKVDDTLSKTSANPIQNKVVTEEFERISNEVADKQPKGDYALKSEISDAPVKSINGKVGEVQLTASDIGATNIHIGEEKPTDPDVNVWVKIDGDPNGDIPEPYTLPTASADVKGGVKIGEGLRMDGDVLSAVGGGSVDGTKYNLIKTITLTAEQSGTMEIVETFDRGCDGLIITIENANNTSGQKDIYVAIGRDGLQRGCGGRLAPEDAMRCVFRILDGTWDIFGYIGHPAGASAMIGQISAQNVSATTYNQNGFNNYFAFINMVRVYTFASDGFPTDTKIKLFGKAANT